MKPLGMLLLVILFPAAALGQQLQGDADTDREIRRQSERYFNAIERHNVKTLDRLLLDNCVICYAWGPGDAKAVFLKGLSKPLPVAKPAADGKRPADAKPPQPGYTLADVSLRRSGNTAILAAVMTRAGINEPGLINTHRRTLVWVRQQGRWRLLQDQWSLVGDALFAQYWSIFFHGNDQNFKREPNSLLVQAVKGRRPGKGRSMPAWGRGETRSTSPSKAGRSQASTAPRGRGCRPARGHQAKSADHAHSAIS